MQTQCSEWASLWLYAQLRDKRHRWAQYLDVPQSPRDLGDLCSHYNLFWSFSSNTASKRLTSVLLAHDSHYSSAACSATTYGQSDNQQDSRTVTVADLHENISKNDKIYILAGLNKSFPGTEQKSRMSSCSIFLTNAIGQSVLINTALRFDSNYKGSRRTFISNFYLFMSKPKFKFLAANIWSYSTQSNLKISRQNALNSKPQHDK